jgi:hypothetical protein
MTETRSDTALDGASSLMDGGVHQAGSHRDLVAWITRDRQPRGNTVGNLPAIAGHRLAHDFATTKSIAIGGEPTDRAMFRRLRLPCG